MPILSVGMFFWVFQVGYTNAGKSTLLNRLSGAGVLAEDRLFATLDPTTRRVEVCVKNGHYLGLVVLENLNWVKTQMNNVSSGTDGFSVVAPG